jgi:hypothetical protein
MDWHELQLHKGAVLRMDSESPKVHVQKLDYAKATQHYSTASI